jgi:threonine aldolase
MNTRYLHILFNLTFFLLQFGGVQANKLRNKPDGTFCIEEMKQNIRPDDDHYPKTSLVCLENTHNMCGGRVVPQNWIDEVRKGSSVLII